MFVARRRAREKGLASLHVVGEAASGQHHAFRRTDFDFAFYRRHHRTAHNAILHDQTPGGRGFDQLNPSFSADFARRATSATPLTNCIARP